MNGTLILDCEGVSRLVGDDRWVMSQVAAARQEQMRVLTSAASLVEARDPKVSQARFDWAISRIDIAPVTEEVARQASKLLAEHRMHGHGHAIDAMVAATAAAAPSPRIIFTSDLKEMTKLCGKSVRVVSV
jgi:predicted nucleic acid-binding protein